MRGSGLLPKRLHPHGRSVTEPGSPAAIGIPFGARRTPYGRHATTFETGSEMMSRVLRRGRRPPVGWASGRCGLVAMSRVPCRTASSRSNASARCEVAQKRSAPAGGAWASALSRAACRRVGSEPGNSTSRDRHRLPPAPPRAVHRRQLRARHRTSGGRVRRGRDGRRADCARHGAHHADASSGRHWTRRYAERLLTRQGRDVAVMRLVGHPTSEWSVPSSCRARTSCLRVP